MTLPLVCVALAAGTCLAQAQQPEPAVNVTSGTVAACDYPIGSGSTKVSMVGKAVASKASGEVKVDARVDGTTIELKVTGMPQPTTLGAEFLTYVLWAVTPDGATTNLGEIPINQNGDGQMGLKAQSQAFALIVTAEPYYAVHLPSELVVMQDEPPANMKGEIYPDNTYKLMKRSNYSKSGNTLALTPDLKKGPLDMYEARNAVEIAGSRGAQKYAPAAFSKAKSSLQMAEDLLSQNSGRNQVISAARLAIQFAEDARALSAQQEEAERTQKKMEGAAAAAAATAKAQANLQAAAEAQRQAELTAAKEAQMNAEAAAEQSVLQAKEEAAKEEADRSQQAIAALRTQLLQQLNHVLQTTDTPRGLIVNMADVLFGGGKYGLSIDAQLKLAKLSGLIQAHPGLILAVEGYTDSAGAHGFNMRLSQQRADAVREFLIVQGLSGESITSTGFGEGDPIADNNTPAGRSQNRRVEIIVSGAAIGEQMIQ
jgi:outer membrane protein OmpA-like peptidoglycan-associated protein